MEWVFLNAATWPDWLRGKKNDPQLRKLHDGPRH
jgi:hypothetical protein